MWYEMTKHYNPKNPRVLAISEDKKTEEMLLSENYDIKFSNNSIHLEFLSDKEHFF
jgi:hypothetical protein